ncbi:MAG: single-stranded-DNA-specific exonuclease RecJ [Ruminococcaceae bacterium]|nr:single-stranded-DNA-specific exonuclease RecJ [Oscillospiraceae bacterium]
MQIRRWNEQKTDKTLAAELAEACEIHPFLSLMLTSRGLTTPEQIFEYIVGYEEEVDPFSFADMQKAVKRTKQALEAGERILVYGDYDVDGITSTTLLYDYFKKQGADVLYRLPSRDEGYGMHPETIAWAAQHGVQLIITVDTGIAALEEVTLANNAGIDVVVTDHHQPGETLPNAVAVVDPHRIDCESSFKEFAGVGVAFMFLCALSGDSETMFTQYGDLLALGTLADMMPLQGFNRDLVRRCLCLLEESRRPGLLALRRVAGLEEKTLDVGNVSFGLAPRLNSSGRMADPNLSLRLLLSENREEANRAAEEIQQLNLTRQQATTDIVQQVEEQLQQHPEWLYDRVLVVCGRGWHCGLLGLVAARLMERYCKPTIALSIGEDGLAHGSCRSLSEFSIFDALSACAEYVVQFGGHELAAGVTLEADKVDALRTAINTYAAEHYPVMPTASFDVAVRLRPDQINTEKLELLQVLEPFGCGNPAPLFGLFRMQLDNITAVGAEKKHLRLSLSRDGVRINAMLFQTRPEEFPVACGSLLNSVVALEKNEFRGNTTVSVRIRDLSFADTDRDQLMREIADFERIMRREYCPELDDVLASREQLGHLYSLLRTCKVWQGTVEQLHHALGDKAPTVLQLLVALQLWQESGLICWYDRGEKLFIETLPAEGKVDLTETPLYQYIQKGDAPNVG